MNEVIQFITQHDRFAVVTHLNPDGDACGSAVALAQGLRNLGKRAEVILLSELPKKYDFEFFQPLCAQLDSIDDSAYDAVIAVDCATRRRLAKAWDFFASKPNCNIDHHISNERYAKINLVLETAAAGEIIYDLLTEMNAPFDPVIRTAVYTAISTDTGNFTYSNTTAHTAEVFSDLLAQGFQVAKAAQKIYRERTFGATKLIARFIDHIRLHYDGKVALSVILEEDLKETGAEPDDLEAVVNYAREIIGVEIAIFIRQLHDDAFKVSLRAGENTEVGAFAERFGGGGHKKAAGFMLHGNLYNIIDQVLSAAKDYI